MEYSEVVSLTKNGFLIPEKLLHPVGIYDSSRCWGTPITNVGHLIGHRAENRPVNQILLSPIPFNSWACTIRIQVRIKDEPGKLKTLLQLLSDKDLKTNIISVSGNPAGYYNGRINIFVEIYDLRAISKKVQLSIREHRDNKNKILEEITLYSIEVLKRISIIKDCINNNNESAKINGTDFLYQTDIDTDGNYLWSNAEKDRIIQDNNYAGELCELFKCASVHSLSCRWLRTQAMAYLYSSIDQPLRFDHILNEKILKSSIQGECSSERIAQSLRLNIPSMFLAAFHPTSKYIRLFSLQTNNQQKKLIKIGYKYNCISNANIGKNDISNNGSNGLLYYLTEKLSKPITLNTVSNQKNSRYPESFIFTIKNIISYSKRESRRSETGAIEILGCCEGISNPPLEDISYSISSQIVGFESSCQNNKETKQFNSTIDVGFATPYRIFLSCREEIKKDTTFKIIYERVARKYGVKIEISDESAEFVTSDVLNRFSLVDAFIIIFSITDTEHQEYMQATDKNKYTPNLGWLLFELGIGMGKKIPTVQLRDITVVTKEQWTQWLNVGKDTSSCFIDRKKPDQMEAHLEWAIRIIISKLSTRKG